MVKGSPKSKAGELIENIARNLVDHPGRLSVEEIPSSPGSILRLKVASEDVGNVTGTNRRTERWLGRFLEQISVKLGHRYSLEIVPRNKER